jgi:hypothetical protein
LASRLADLEQSHAASAERDEVHGQLEGLRGRGAEFQVGLDTASSQVAALDANLVTLSKIEERTAKTEADLQSLTALSDHVMQKTRALEKQWEIVDRATAQAAGWMTWCGISMRG